MITILEHGCKKPKKRKAECSNCGCVFTFSIGDTVQINGLDKITGGKPLDTYVMCPDCEHAISYAFSESVDAAAETV